MRNLLPFFLTIVFYANTWAQEDSVSVVQPADTVVAITEIDSVEVDPADTLENYDPRSIIITTKAGNTKIKKVYQPCVKGEIKTTPEALEEHWKNWFKEKLGEKTKKKKGSLLVEEVNIVDVGSGILNIWANFSATDGAMEIEMAVEVNSSYFVDSTNNPEQFENCKRYLHSIIKSYYTNYYNGILAQLEDQLAVLVEQKNADIAYKHSLETEIVQFKNRIISAKTTKLSTEQSIRKSRDKISKHSELIRVHGLTLADQQKNLEEIEKEKAEGKHTDEKAYLKLKRSAEKKILKTNAKITKSKKIKLNTEQKIVASENKIIELKNEILQREKDIKITEEKLVTADDQIAKSTAKVQKKEAQIDKIKEQLELIF